jgi:hypothetical protein
LVSHQYPKTILLNFGFNPQFINYCTTFNIKISAKILINGHLSGSIDIERGYKEDDDLNCATKNTNLPNI